MFFAEIVPAEHEPGETDNFFLRLTLEYTDDKAKEAAEPEPTRKQSSLLASEQAANKRRASNRRAREKKLKKVLHSSSAEKADLSKVDVIKVLCLRKSSSSANLINETRFCSWEGQINRGDLETQQNSQEQDEDDRRKGDDMLRQILFAFLQASNFSMGEAPTGSTYNVGISVPQDVENSRISATITKQSDSDNNVTYTLHRLDLNPCDGSTSDSVTSTLLSTFQCIDHMEDSGRHFQDLSEKVQKQFAEVSEVANDAVRAKNEFYERVLEKMTGLLNEKKREIIRLRGDEEMQKMHPEGSDAADDNEEEVASDEEGESASERVKPPCKRGRLPGEKSKENQGNSSRKRTRT